MSLRNRLMLGLVAVAAVLIVTNLALSNRFEHFLLDRIDRQLVDASTSTAFGRERPGRPDNRRGPQPEDETLSEYFIAVGRPGVAMRRVGSTIGRAERPAPALDAATVLDATVLDATISRSRPFTAPAESGSGSWRLVALESGPRGVMTVVGLSLDEVEATIRRIRIVQILGTLSVLSTLGLVSWWVLRLGVHPIESMADTADAIAAGDLSRRVDHPGQETEVGRLGIAFNAMLERIQDAFRQREASEERVRRFAADASHELRTPLTSIIGYTELYRAGGLAKKAALDDAMARIEGEGRRMAELVEDLLLLARLDEHRTPATEAIRLDRLVCEAVRDASAVEPGRPMEADLAPVTVNGDESQLRQLVGNLLANARSHTPAGAAVHVRLTMEAERAVLVVADEGPGMDPEVSARVFDRFYRADSSRGRSAGGSGLGLAIVAGVAFGHGGQVTVDSRPGGGSRFQVELPTAPRQPATASHEVPRFGAEDADRSSPHDKEHRDG